MISPLQVEMNAKVLVEQSLDLCFRMLLNGFILLVISCVWPMDAKFISFGARIRLFIQSFEWH